MAAPNITLPDLALANVYQQGLSIEDCARVLRVEFRTVRRRLANLGVEIRSSSANRRRLHWRKRVKLIQELRQAAEAAGLATDLNPRKVQ